MTMILTYGALDLNDLVTYAVDLNGFVAKPPSVKQKYADSAMRHGQEPTEAWKYNNRTLEFGIRVTGQTVAGLDAAVKALEAVVFQANAVVEYRKNGGTVSIYFLAYRPSEVDPSTYFERVYEDSLTAIVRWQVEGYPFGYTSRQTLYFARNLGVNDSFEKRSGNDFENFVETVSGGTITANTSEHFTGGVSAKMATFHESHWCRIDDLDYLPVDATHHHNAKMFIFPHSGIITLHYYLTCYDANGNDFGYLTLMNNAIGPSAVWFDALKTDPSGSPVIYPVGSPYSPAFPAGTVKVKRQARLDTTIGVVSIDSLYLGDTEYIVGHELEGAMAIMVPAGVCLGDVPAPARIHVGSAYCGGPWNPQSSGITDDLIGIYACDATHGWATWLLPSSSTQNVLSFNGATWSKLTTLINTNGSYYVDGSATNNVIVVSKSGAERWNGSSWSLINSGLYPGYAGTPNAIMVLDSTHTWVVCSGYNGKILFYNGTTWSEQSRPSGIGDELQGISAYNSTNVWAVGGSQTIFYFNGTSWSDQSPAGGGTLRSVCALDASHVWAVGDAGLILFFNGTSWSQQTSGVTKYLTGVYAYDSTHVWAVGQDGTILFFNGTTWTSQGSGTANTLRSVSGISATEVWAVGDNGTILKGVSTVGAMPMTNLVVAESDNFAENWAAVQDAAGATQVLDCYRRGQYYRSLAAGGAHKFRFPVGTHAGRYILSIGTSWASTTTYDQLSIKLYLETADGTKISATDISLAALDLGNPITKFKETAFQSARLADITLPSHYVSPNANQDNIYQVVEVTNNASAPAEWLDCCSLIPADGAVELSSISSNFLIFDSEHGEVLSSQDGSFDTAAVFDPTKTVDSPRFEADPNGINMVVLAGNTNTGDDRLDPKLDLMMSWEPQWLMIPEAAP